VLFFLVGTLAMLFADSDEKTAAVSWANAKALKAASSLLLVVFLLTLLLGRHDLLALEIGSMLLLWGLVMMSHLVWLSVRDAGRKGQAAGLIVVLLVACGFGLVAVTA